MNERLGTASFKGIVRRRRGVFVLVFLPVLLMAVATAFLLPAVFVSKCTILVENQQIPQEYVRTTITSYVEERLQMITQQILSRTKLLEIINRFDLYADARARYTVEEILERMRKAIHLETISAEVIDRRTGRPSSATIAFAVSYEGKEPSKVHKVANVLASLYLEENLKSREEQASSTTTFLQRELDELKVHIDELERQISAFKKAHTGELPEYTAINLQAVERLNRDVDQLDARIRSLQERKIYLEGQLATVEPFLTAPEKPLVITQNDPGERLKQVQLQLVNLQAKVSDLHPDVKRLKKELADLQAQVGQTDDSAEKLIRLEEIRTRLADLQGSLGSQHPDVVKLKREEQALAESLRDAVPSSATAEVLSEEPKPNPAHVNISTQIASAAMEIESLRRESEQVQAKIADYQRRLENAPLVEREYNGLTRDYENAKHKYSEILSKLMEARVAQGMEQSQRSERFTIIDPAQVPEVPDRPNRLAISLIGLVLALGAGVGAAAAQESLDSTVKSVQEVGFLAEAPVLAVFPLLETREERRSRLVRRTAWVCAGCATVVVVLLLVHELWAPLDILWVKAQMRLAKGLPL